MHEILDLVTFPLDRPDGAEYAALLARCRADLDRTGMFNLDGFLRAEVAAEAAQALLPRFQNESFLHEREHNIYFSDDPSDLPGNHPARIRIATSNRTLCGDQIPAAPLLDVYEWGPLHRFLAAALDMPALFTMDDAMSRVNVMSYGQGQALNWHFDRSDFTTTLLLQSPDAGGEFEYRTGLRSEDDPNYDGVGALLQGGDPRVETMRATPGTLNVFRGRNTAHRVTPVQGARNRIIAVFSYYPRPGVAFSDAERLGFYGRAS